ncbi:hypothetical protein BD310DRAFT_928468 [Dichomitus squalens]|uniref:Secreted protein n=1 Tax=Dichomitus squalens TaxID=114155 RepID=A0A4Q9PTN8_9APHY|nr:hypothetical protein BD310DRAFT_928468 [Dichomitus squalens]
MHLILYSALGFYWTLSPSFPWPVVRTNEDGWGAVCQNRPLRLNVCVIEWTRRRSRSAVLDQIMYKENMRTDVACSGRIQWPH